LLLNHIEILIGDVLWYMSHGYFGKFYLMLMRCYDTISLRVLKNYLCMFWINWRCSI